MDQTHNLLLCNVVPYQSALITFTVVADDSFKMHDALEALFIKLDHAACCQNTQDWEMLASLLWQTISVHGKSSLNELWSERADWWPSFHFRADLVPIKCSVTDQEWELPHHKAEVARCLLGESMVALILGYRTF